MATAKPWARMRNMDNIADTVSKLLQGCSSSEVEIEARIRKQLVNKDSQHRLVDGLGAQWKTDEYEERKRISKSSRRCAYRQRDGTHNSLTVCKSSIAKEDANDEWCTLHVSAEVPTHSMHNALASVEPIYVTRLRAEVEGHYIDVIFDNNDYRVEVEVCNARDFNLESTLAVVRRVCALLQGSGSFVGYYDWFTVVHVAKTPFGPFCIHSGGYQKPRTMTAGSVLEIAADVNCWLATPKIDGERRFVVAIDDRVFSVGLARDVMHEGSVSGNRGVSILDCEYTKNDKVYHIFDAVVVDGAYLPDSQNLHERLVTAEWLCSMMSDNLRHRIEVKEYCPFDSFDKLCALHDRFEKDHMGAVDGIVFVSTAESYMQNVYKWKQCSTIDLMVTEDGNLITCDKYVVNHPIEGAEVSPGIWEFDYDRHTKTLHPKRPRPDKPQANSRKIVEINMHRAVPGSIFSGVGCYLMRKYHNRVKVDMIKCANDVNAVIMDIGTGQGGDMDKWCRARAVYCIEPSTNATAEMSARFSAIRRPMPYINVISVPLRELSAECIDKKVDIFTAFFCMNLFKNEDWETLSRVIMEKGSSKCRLLAIAITAPRDHKGRCFSIDMAGPSAYKISIHGTRILDIREIAVKPAALTKAMENCGMKLMKSGRLNNDNFMTKEERALSAMYEMFVFKKRTGARV